MPAPPPGSTLFPYTTLFRSLRGRRDAADNAARTRTMRPTASLRDRKSTRLNSSHGSISYAVFCLKKKKTDDDSDVDLASQLTYKGLRYAELPSLASSFGCTD